MDQLIADNVTCLRQGIHFLDRLPPLHYVQPCTACFDSTIGGHFRHNIDHYEQFLDGVPKRKINYDDRSRRIEVETESAVARDAMQQLMDKLSALEFHGQSEAPLEVLMDGGSDARWTLSSVSRELQFLISHTIHHYAMIVTIAHTQGFTDFSTDFGVAPSTLKHRSHSA
jgi:hypothetical protein